MLDERDERCGVTLGNADLFMADTILSRSVGTSVRARKLMTKKILGVVLPAIKLAVYADCYFK